jgi:hypothetical protein
MSVSPEMMTKVALWREKARSGQLSREEMREAIVFLRAERQAVPPAASRSTKSQAASVNTDDLLGQLDNL